MTKHRRDGLTVLSRLKRHEIEAVAQQMAEVNRALAQIETERQYLLNHINERGDTDGVESARVQSAFIRNVSETIHRKEAKAVSLRESSAEVHNHLNGLFADVKRLEMISSRRAEQRKQRRNQLETAAQNEAFLAIWLQDRGAS
jgi:flagellar biosynthesis chaperone FliJ